MPTYLYCLTRQSEDAAARGAAPVPASGIDGTPTRSISLAAGDPPAERTRALVTSLPAPPALTAAHAIEHDAVCAAAIARGDDVVPARYAQLFADDEALLADYDRRVAALEPVWRRIARAVEMGLTIAVNDDAPTRLTARDPAATIHRVSGDAAADPKSQKASSTGTGYAYLTRVAGPIRERRRLRARIEPFRAEFGQAASALVRSEVVRLQAAPPGVAIAHLIGRDAIAEYETLAAKIAVAHPSIRVLVSGPYAPYSFVSLDDRGP